MNWNDEQLIEFFQRGGRNRLLTHGQWGIEKESQRVTCAGDLALTDHPAGFGSKMGNPFITTDFAESQLELITPPFAGIEDTYAFLVKLQAMAEEGIGDELLWPLSMPPRLPDETRIPIAKLDDSYQGRKGEIYRQGLALRYGKKMQMISGIHFNFSMGVDLMEELYGNFAHGQTKQTFINDSYFALARNLLRYRWLLIYLFGASPSVDASYDSVIFRELKMIEECCPEYYGMMGRYRHYATSLRVSRFGYSNPEQGKNNTFFDNIEKYVKNIRGLLSGKSSIYQKLGIYQNGVQMQLNDNILQRESEFYVPVRFKQNVRDGETQLDALEDRGVQYVEVRLFDLNPFEKVGIGLGQLHFLQIFMLFCLFEPSPRISVNEWDLINRNHHAVALFGRDKSLRIHHYTSGPVLLQTWGMELFQKLKPIAMLMDQGCESDKYQGSLEEEYQKILSVAVLPSFRMEREMRTRKESFLKFGVRHALQQKNMFVDGGEKQDASF